MDKFQTQPQRTTLPMYISLCKGCESVLHRPLLDDASRRLGDVTIKEAVQLLQTPEFYSATHRPDHDPQNGLSEHFARVQPDLFPPVFSAVGISTETSFRDAITVLLSSKFTGTGIGVGFQRFMRSSLGHYMGLLPSRMINETEHNRIDPNAEKAARLLSHMAFLIADNGSFCHRDFEETILPITPSEEILALLRPS